MSVYYVVMHLQLIRHNTIVCNGIRIHKLKRAHAIKLFTK